MTAVSWNLIAMPLTPIHVGDGSVMAPEDYRLTEGKLERFSASAVLRDMSEPQRRAYLARLDEGRLAEAWSILRDQVRPTHVRERLSISGASREDLGQILTNPQAKGELRPFIRSGGRPMIPGSSIKGALRTSVLSMLAQPRAAEIEQIKRDARRTASDRMQCLLLGHDNQDQDPFRFVHVGDLALPDGATRVDCVVNWRPRRAGDEGSGRSEIPMHYERTLARIDGERPRWEVRIRLDFARMAEARRRNAAKAPRVGLTPADLRRAVNDFHWKIWDDERAGFFADEPATVARLADSFRIPAPGGVALDEAAVRASPHFLLLRIGRFGQFESKSLETFREGWNAQGRPPRAMARGSTRNVIRLPARHRAGAAPLPEGLAPMGWLLCYGSMT
jgi:CRISPR-associated protein Csm5